MTGTDDGADDPRAVAELLRSTGTAGVSAALRRRGYTEVFVDGVRPLAPGMRFAGPARTLRFVPYRPDLFAERGRGVNPQKRAFDEVRAGEVLVIGARGRADAGTLGDVLATRATVRGAAAVVTDGGVRDATAVAALGLPVFAAGHHPAVLGRRHVPWETDVVIACGGAAVVPGDLVVGDDDGVLVVPAALAAEVARDAQRQEREDAWVVQRVADGHPVAELFPMNEQWRARYEAAGASEGE